MRLTTYAAVAAVALGLGAISVAVPRAQQDTQATAQTAAADANGVEPQAGLFAWSGGFVRGKLARTQTAASALAEGAWRPLPSAVLTRVIPAGTTDLFNVAFSAECQVRSLGNGDTARIRIAHFVNGVQVAPMEPYDGDQRFCAANNPPATHKGNWVGRFGAGTHVIRVEIFPTDFAPDNGVIAAVIDDWTFELVVYD
jgi:hypothetical protein